MNNSFKFPLNKVLYLIPLLYPFYIIGFKVGDYPFNLILVAIFILDLVLIFKSSFYRYLTFTFILLIIWFLIADALNHRFSNVLSISSFILMMLPLLSNTNKYIIDKNKFLRILIIGFYISTAYAFYQLFAFISGLPLLEDYLPLAREFNPYMLNIIRIKSFFKEPSHYMPYLMLVYILVDSFGKDIKIKEKVFIKFLIIIQIIISLSLTGLILFLSYYITKIFRVVLKFHSRLKVKTTRKAFLGIIVLTTILLITPQVSPSINTEYVPILINRIDKLSNVIFSNNYNSSEAVRTNVLYLIPEFIEKEGWIKSLFGTGYSGSSKWIVAHNPQFLGGNIQNLFVLVFISSGWLGLFLFIIFLLQVFKKYKFKIHQVLFIILIMSSMGYLINYFIWMIIFILKIFNNLQQHQIYMKA